MRRLPRERFLPPGWPPLAYADEDVPLGDGRVLMEPMVHCASDATRAPCEGERALVVAAGAGYGAALLAACGARVTALEDDQALLALARRALAEFAPTSAWSSGPLAAGWPPGAPYDVILIEGAVHDIPAAIGEQLRSEARPAGRRSGTGGQWRPGGPGRGHGGGLRAQPLFDCATPPIPSLLPAPVFVF